mgnify:FL=1
MSGKSISIMRLVTLEEYNILKVIIEKEMIKLAKHENKNIYLAKMAINNCFVRDLSENIQLFQLYSPGFIHIVEQYINALEENPECFGTNDAKDVIHALYLQAQKHNCVWNETRFKEYLSNETFCLLACRKNRDFVNDMLRIDLFRHIKESKDTTGHFYFEGGIFHVLKHFSIGHQCASILPNQNVSLYDIEQLIWPIAKAFYEGPWKKGKRKNTFETHTIYLNKCFILEFYKEENSNVSFVNTLIPKSI